MEKTDEEMMEGFAPSAVEAWRMTPKKETVMSVVFLLVLSLFLLFL